MSKQKGLILCNGQMPPKGLIRRYLNEEVLFIAADGGGNKAFDMGFIPEVIIGDLDSFDITKMSGLYSTKVIKDTDQETNDLEKALAYILKVGISEVVILGATNMRLDHSLKNLSVMSQFNEQFKSIQMIDEYGSCFILPKKFTARFDLGTTVSLVPLSGEVKNVVTEGLKYPLKNESLVVGKRDGSSNETIQETIKIEHGEGQLLFYVVEATRTRTLFF
jgi:thiamine pyrophosphokinase